MVLCAGFGTRLGELTREIPKPMLMLEGHPLLAYLLGHLRRHGFDRIAINLHFKPETIRAFFGDRPTDDLQLSYSHETELLGTAGGLKNVEHFFEREESFLVQYGDIITDQNFSLMVQFHREHKALATLLLHQRCGSNSVVTLDEQGRIIGFLERPSEAVRCGNNSPWVNSGICVCSPEILRHIPAGTVSDLPRDVFAPLVATGRLYGFPLSGFRCAIDSPERLDQARAALHEGHCRIEPVVPMPQLTKQLP